VAETPAVSTKEQRMAERQASEEKRRRRLGIADSDDLIKKARERSAKLKMPQIDNDDNFDREMRELRNQMAVEGDKFRQGVTDFSKGVITSTVDTKRVAQDALRQAEKDARPKFQPYVRKVDPPQSDASQFGLSYGPSKLNVNAAAKETPVVESKLDAPATPSRAQPQKPAIQPPISTPANKETIALKPVAKFIPQAPQPNKVNSTVQDALIAQKTSKVESKVCEPVQLVASVQSASRVVHAQDIVTVSPTPPNVTVNQEQQPKVKAASKTHHTCRYVSRLKDIDELLAHKYTSFDDAETCMVALKKSVCASSVSPRLSSRRRQLRVYCNAQQEDVDKMLYAQDDYRTLMRSLSPTSKVTLDFYANLTQVCSIHHTHPCIVVLIHFSTHT
jgi:hypothetical protein